MPPGSVERAERPTVAHFRHAHFEPSTPVVLAGIIDHWRARTWTTETLAQRLGDHAVPLAVLHGGHVRADPERGIVFETKSLRWFLDRIGHDQPPRYYLRLRLAGPHAFLRDDLDIPRYCLRSITTDVSLLIGGPGTIVDTHYDMLHNLVAQLRGRRRITLFPPNDRDCLYPYPVRTLHWHHSQIRLEAPDPVAFPRFGDAHPRQVEIGPGEVLFIPRGWWHHFESLEPSVAVHFFWLTPRLLPAVAVARGLWMMKRVYTY